MNTSAFFPVMGSSGVGCAPATDTKHAKGSAPAQASTHTSRRNHTQQLTKGYGITLIPSERCVLHQEEY
jgi:hypothetical protein